MSVSRWLTDSRGAETGARGFELDQPDRPPEPAELSDAEYAASFALRFGFSAAETVEPTGEDDGYAVEFERRFGIEATA